MATRERPLSPHLQVYRWQMQMVTSILHRATGVFLSLGVLVIAAGLLALMFGPEPWDYFQVVSISGTANVSCLYGRGASVTTCATVSGILRRTLVAVLLSAAFFVPVGLPYSVALSSPLVYGAMWLLAGGLYESLPYTTQKCPWSRCC